MEHPVPEPNQREQRKSHFLKPTLQALFSYVHIYIYQLRHGTHAAIAEHFTSWMAECREIVVSKSLSRKQPYFGTIMGH